MSDEPDTNALSRQDPGDLIAELQRAVTSHEEIGHAVGVLIAVHRILPAQGWELLRATSQRTNIKAL